MLGRKQYCSALQALHDGECCRDRDGVDTGVWCTSEVPSGLVLGSFEGELRLGDGMKDERHRPYMLQIRYVDGKIITNGASQDGDVPWMRFISAARNDVEQNTEATTNTNGQVILRTMRRILIGEELLVWYSDRLQHLMNIQHVLPSRDRAGHLFYVCQFCCKSYQHPNTLKSHLRFNCVSASVSSSMLLSSCQPISRPKNAFDVGLPMQWSRKSTHYLGSMVDISLLRSLADTVTHAEASVGFRAFKPMAKCSEHHRSAFKAHREKDSSVEDVSTEVVSSKIQISSPELEASTHFPIIKSAISSSSYDLTSGLHSRLHQYSVPSLNFSCGSFADASLRNHFNAPSCVTYGCSCYHHRLHDIRRPIESLPHHQYPFDCRISSNDRRPSTSSTDVTQRWPFYTLLPYPTGNCSVEGSKDCQNSPPPPEPRLTLQDTSQSIKGKRGHLCIYCGKFYSRKYGLKIHLRTHTGYKPLKCKVCLRPFGDPSNLNKHIRLHAEGETPYRCEFCGKVLVRRRDLERHIKSRHPTETSQNKDDELINVDDITSSSVLCDNDSDDEPTIKDSEAKTCDEIKSNVE